MCNLPSAKMFSFQWQSLIMPTDFQISVLYSLVLFSPSVPALISLYSLCFCISVMQKNMTTKHHSQERNVLCSMDNIHFIQKYSEETHYSSQNVQMRYSSYMFTVEICYFLSFLCSILKHLLYH